VKIFLDTAKLDEIRKWRAIIDGVTTNPTILLKDGGNIHDVCKELDPLPVSVEAVGDFETDARTFVRDIPNCNVKIPLLKPDGGNNIDLIKKLADEGVQINCTALFSLPQVILAAKAGARYVSLFVGRIDDEGMNPWPVVQTCSDFLITVPEIHTLSNHDGSSEDMLRCPELIVGSIRTVSHVVQSFVHGADIVTIPPAILEKMVMHRYSLETVRQFERDAQLLGKLNGVKS